MIKWYKNVKGTEIKRYKRQDFKDNAVNFFPMETSCHEID